MSIEKTSRVTVRVNKTGITAYLRYRGDDAWPKLNQVYEKYKGKEVKLKISYDK